MAELVTFGETMLRMAPAGADRLETSQRFDVRVGGAESNVAVAASRLGVDAAWLSKLPDTALGRRIVTTLRRHGVEPAVVWSDDGRVGVYYFEHGGAPATPTAIYDRADAAVTTATVDELPIELVESADAFLVSGITPALSATLAETTEALLALARDAGTATAFDLNYRSKLWSTDDARDGVTRLLPSVDVFFGAERDVRAVLGRDGAASDMARALAADYGLDTAVVTCSERGAVAAHGGTVYEQDAFRADVADPVGTGDAFAGAFLARRLRGATVPSALAYGAAAAALTLTLPGDMALVTPAEVEAVIEGAGRDIAR